MESERTSETTLIHKTVLGSISQLNDMFLRYISVYFVSCEFRLARSVSIVISTIFLGSVVITRAV